MSERYKVICKWSHSIQGVNVTLAKSEQFNVRTGRKLVFSFLSDTDGSEEFGN